MQAQFNIMKQGEMGDALSLSISGRMDIENLSAMLQEIRDIFQTINPSSVTVDLAGVSYLDSGGALFLVKLRQEAKERNISVNLVNMTEKAQGMLKLLDNQRFVPETIAAERPQRNIFHGIGETSIGLMKDIEKIIAFGGQVLVETMYSLIHPRSVRWGDVLEYMRKVGSEGFPIVSLISFLLGLIMAFMSYLQLKVFGANIYVATLVAIAMVKELGPIMTAIIVAGRSGSAFAAEIGTMKVNEEVDALVTMGFNPVRFLAIPKILAAMLTVPLLTVFSIVFAIIGGLIVGVTAMDLTFYSYMEETIKSIGIFDFITSIVKSAILAVLIAGIGCQRGFETRGGAQAVGTATTSAVVSGLFIIIITDSIFAIVLYYI